MRVIYWSADQDQGHWVPALRAALPGADVYHWQPASGDPRSAADQADYAVVWKPPQALLDSQERLKALFVTGAGVDALLQLQMPTGVPVVRLDDAGMSVQMAEYVCHAVIRHYREFEGYEADMRAGHWSYRKPRSRADFPVGILGLGVLGERVARAVAHFDFPVNGWARSAKQIPGVKCFAGAESLNAFLAATRVLVCLLPLTEATCDLLNRECLARLQPGGYLINVARGAHVVDRDLVALIDEGHLAGATLDVFRTEPLPAEHPFWGHPKINLTPHTSARTLRSESIAQIANKIAALERGEPVAGLVDVGRGY